MILLTEEEWETLYEVLDTALVVTGIPTKVRNEFFQNFNETLESYHEASISASNQPTWSRV